MINTNVTTELYNKNKFDTYYEMPYMTYHIVRINPMNGVSQFYDDLGIFTKDGAWLDGCSQLVPFVGFSGTMENLFEALEDLNPDYIITLVIVGGYL